MIPTNTCRIALQVCLHLLRTKHGKILHGIAFPVKISVGSSGFGIARLGPLQLFASSNENASLNVFTVSFGEKHGSMYDFSYTHVSSARSEALKTMSVVSGKPVDGCYPTTVPKGSQKDEDKMGTGRPEDPG